MVGEQIINAIKIHHPNSDLYVGINPSSLANEWINIIRNSGINNKIIITPQHLVTNSDASAYQAALNLLKQSKKSYDLIWFFQTKSAYQQKSYNIFVDFLDNFISKPKEAREVFLKNKNIGSYSLYTVIHPKELNDVWSSYLKMQFKWLPIMHLYTLFVLRGKPVHYFLNNCNKNFFEEPLLAVGGTNRYYFERDFYQIIYMLGYLPATKNVIQLHFNNWDAVVSNRENFDKIVNNRNKLLYNIKMI